MLTGRVAFCSFCKRERDLEILEDEQHIWLQYEESGQALAWEMAERIWNKLQKGKSLARRDDGSDQRNHCPGIRRRLQQVLREATYPGSYDNMGNKEV